MELRPKQLLKEEYPGLEMVGDSPHEVSVALDFPMETATLDDWGFREGSRGSMAPWLQT